MRKRFFSFLLAAILLFSVAALGSGAAFAEGAEATDTNLQIGLISSQAGELKQADSQNIWYYTVTDLDHDGNLEFVAASQHPMDRSTNLKVWEVGADRKTLTECSLDKDPDESFPDILTDSADTYHNPQTDTWYYLLYDNVIISSTEVYTIKTAVSLKDGVISYEPFAIEHTIVEGTLRSVTHTDANGIDISPAQYNAAGAEAFADLNRSSTSFEWLIGADLEDSTRLSGCYAVFTGDKAPTERLPFPMPTALETPETTPAPAPTPVPAQTPVPVQPAPAPAPIWLTITKNPTNENKKTGGTAYFVACANIFDSLTWTFVSPDGGEFSPQSFVAGTKASIGGEYGTTLSVSNVESWMNGWGAYCTFYYQGQTARTSTAYIYVDGKKEQTPDWKQTPGSMSGTAYRDSDGLLCVFLQNGNTVYLPNYSKPGYICNIYGELYAAGGGASCIVYYIGSPTADNIYQIEVYGDYPDANPSDDDGFSDYYLDDGTEVIVVEGGPETWIDPEGNWYTVNPDGSWEYYDATTGITEGGIG